MAESQSDSVWAAAFMVAVGLFWLLVPMTPWGREFVLRLGAWNQWWFDHPIAFTIFRLVTCVPFIAIGIVILVTGG